MQSMVKLERFFMFKADIKAIRLFVLNVKYFLILLSSFSFQISDMLSVSKCIWFGKCTDLYYFFAHIIIEKKKKNVPIQILVNEYFMFSVKKSFYKYSLGIHNLHGSFMWQVP